MRKKIKRRIKMKKGFKILVTIFILITSVQLYYDLAVLGQQQNSNFDIAMLVLGWFWLIFGQISILHLIWEK